jgi:hypothetical protein
MCSINGGKVVGSCPSFKCGLFGVLSAFDALFEGVFEAVPVCHTNTGMLVAEVTVWPDGDVFIVWVSFDFVV